MKLRAMITRARTITGHGASLRAVFPAAYRVVMVMVEEIVTVLEEVSSAR